MDLRFDQQDYQQAAVTAVVDTFVGQPREEGWQEVATPDAPERTCDFVALANRLVLSDDAVLANLRAVRSANRIADETGDQAARFPLGWDTSADHSPSLSIEMETGTGKTYVMLCTIHALHQAYGWSRFVIVVPSVAIRAGTIFALEATASHFADRFGGVPVEVWDYDSREIERVRQFATTPKVQILVITVQSFHNDRTVMTTPRDRTQYHRPIDFLQACRPVVFLDEPQKLDSDLQREAINNLRPLFTLRYSATHREAPNLVYRLGPVEAYERRLVKEIVVHSVLQDDDHNRPYVKLMGIGAKGKQATVELELDLQQAGGIKRTVKRLMLGKSLHEVTGRGMYEGLSVERVDPVNRLVQLGDGLTLSEGQSIGGHPDAIARHMIAQTIRYHLNKELTLHRTSPGQGMKVLSLFFIDRVANYWPQDGKFRVMFQEEYTRLAADPTYRPLALPPAAQVQTCYFAHTRKNKQEVAVDSDDRSSATKDEAYEEIIRDKRKLLDRANPHRFIFSHSALGEGWDNPNVFQICSLAESWSLQRRRQMIGRGLRLPVRDDGSRCHDQAINRLVVVANESFTSFATALQRDFADDGIHFSKKPANAHERQVVSLRKERLTDPDFEALWQRIRPRTRYRVAFDTAHLITIATAQIRDMEPVPAPRLRDDVRRLSFRRDDQGRLQEIGGDYQTVQPGESLPSQGPLPDVVEALMERTSLRRRTIIAILIGSGTLAQFLTNPQLYIERVGGVLNRVRRDLMAEGVIYERLTLGDHEYTLSLFDERETEAFLDWFQTDKSLHTLVHCESEVERTFAEEMEADRTVQFFVKLPERFRIQTPLGGYNPDWAIVRKLDGQVAKVYLVRETKSVPEDQLPEDERLKVKCGRKHFKALGNPVQVLEDYKVVRHLADG